MMINFHTLYKPLTSRPFLCNHTYMEYQPCEKLLPYIACYWEMNSGSTKEQADDILVIPDTCLDIIVHINHTRGTVEGGLCGIQDKPFILTQSEEAGTSVEIITSFAVRFHFWSASLFLKLNLKDTCNQNIELAALGQEWQSLFNAFMYITDIKNRIGLVEAFLLKMLCGTEGNAAVFNSIQQILLSSGRKSMKEICLYSCISQRQLERLFLLEVGLSPKRTAKLVRYQNVWREIALQRDVDIHDVALRYGYTDQAHLLNEFKRFHGISPGEAKKIAHKNR